MAKIGFIGLGNMGGPMARNLVTAGHELLAFDLSSDALRQLEQVGAQTVTDPHDAVKNVDYVITMLPSGKVVEDLYIHETALLNSISTDTLVIDCSTVAPLNSQTVIAAAKAKGIAMIDAPVSGGTGGASAGTLTFICGGEEANVAKAKPILMLMGKNVFRAGDAGAGQTAKICNNMLLAIHMIGTAETLQMGVDNGLDPKVLSDIMTASSGRNWSLEVYNPYPDVMENVPAAKGYQGGFMVDLMNKDLGLAMEAALNSHSTTPMGSLAKNLYAIHGLQGNGKLDFSSIQKLFAELYAEL